MPSRSPASWTMGRIEARCAISMLPGKGAEGAEDASGMAWAVASRDGGGHATRAVHRGSVGPWLQSDPMLWLKAFHIVFVVSWFAGLFYLPRLFVYHAQAEDAVSRERFKVMERKLYRGIMTPAMVLTLVSGIWMWLGYGFSGAWLHAKVALVVLLVVYHFWMNA